jgi:hypothetical protein
VHCDAVNGERIALALARSLERERDELHARLDRVLELADFGAANAPMYATR